MVIRVGYRDTVAQFASNVDEINKRVSVNSEPDCAVLGIDRRVPEIKVLQTYRISPANLRLPSKQPKT